MDCITSKLNEKVKYIKSLNEKKYRQKYNEYYLEGIKVVSEAIDMYKLKAIDIKFIACSYDIVEKLNGGKELIKKIKSISQIEVINFKKEIFEYMVDTVTTQGILVVIKLQKDTDEITNIIKNNSKNLLILDGIQDQGNLGTIIRTANAFEIENIFCINNTTDIYSQKVLRSTMGSIFKVKVTYINNENLKNQIQKLKELGYILVATLIDSNNLIQKFNFNNKYAFVIGNEANGVSEFIKKECDDSIKIPMNENIDSLNVGIATGILLYEQYKK